MKRILIIFMGLILGCNLASAKSVSCWEEYTSDNTYINGEATYESRLKSALGTETTILSTGVEYTGVFVLSDYGVSYFRSPKSYGVYNSNPHNSYWTRNYGIYTHYTHSSGGSMYNYGKIYHYCIVDEGSSGGGGATGSVNFIIKATS